MSFTLPSILFLATLPFLAAGDAAAPQPAPAADQPAAQARPMEKRFGKGARRAFRAPQRGQVAMRMVLRQLLLNRYDANGDGELDAEERRCLMEDAQAARKQQALNFIQQFDTNGDGKLDASEREAMKKAIAQRRHAKGGAAPQQPAQAGNAAPQPRQAASGQGRRPHAQGKGKRRPQGQRPHSHPMDKEGQLAAIVLHQLTMDAYDADKDGQLDQRESARLREDGEKLYAEREAALLAEHDADKDGRISREELRAAMKALFPRPEGAKPQPRTEEARPQPRHKAGHGKQPRRGWMRGPRRPRGGFHYLLDTHFDADILLNLARPQAADGGAEPAAPAPQPCAPSTPSVN